jgi:Leucine-rich repeat (LRR) protein
MRLGRFVPTTRIVAIVTALAAGQAAQAGIFPDQNLEAVIKEILKKKQIDKPEIEEADLKTIFFLEAEKKGIKDLTGLEKCTNLASVKLARNEIESIQALADLKNIQTLTLSGNKIVDLTPLAGLVKLQLIDVADNQIEKLDALAGLENLRTFWAANNKIVSLDPLAKLGKIQSLIVDGNQIDSLAPLKDVKWLSTLRIANNKVSDLSPLVGLTDLKYTFLNGNPVSDLGPLVEMARKDVEGEQRFAPYWNLFLDVDKLPDAAKAQVEELKKLGVRVNPEKK